jgi:hypothetical protein
MSAWFAIISWPVERVDVTYHIFPFPPRLQHSLQHVAAALSSRSLAAGSMATTWVGCSWRRHSVKALPPPRMVKEERAEDVRRVGIQIASLTMRHQLWPISSYPSAVAAPSRVFAKGSSRVGIKHSFWPRMCGTGGRTWKARLLRPELWQWGRHLGVLPLNFIFS